MKTIAIANQKGGTGKTTTAYNLGIALTQQGYRVLMVDFDPQGNLSCYCGIPPEQDLDQTLTELLMKVAGEKPLYHRECAYRSKRVDDGAPQVDFIPSNLRLAGFELAMGTMMCREILLRSCLEHYDSQYDYCIIDCSPSVGLLLTNALSAADEVIIPMQAQPFSVVGMSQLTDSVFSVQRKINPKLHIMGILLTMTQHTKVSEHYAADVRARYGNKLRVFDTEIPYNVKVQESQALVTAADYDAAIGNLGKRQISLSNEIAALQEKKKGFAAIAKSLETCRTLKLLWQQYTALSLKEKSVFYTAHAAELQAYHSAAAKLEKAEVDQTVEAEKVIALAENLEQRIQTLKEQRREAALQEQNTRREQQVIMQIQDESREDRCGSVNIVI